MPQGQGQGQSMQLEFDDTGLQSLPTESVGTMIEKKTGSPVLGYLAAGAVGFLLRGAIGAGLAAGLYHITRKKPAEAAR